MAEDIKENILGNTSPYSYKAYFDANNNNATNPVEQENRVNEIQLYFNDKYFNIRSFVEDISKRLSKDGLISDFINECTLKYASILGEYILSQKTSDKCFIIIEQNKKILKIRENKALVSVEFDDSGISKIEKKSDSFVEILYFKKKNILSRFFKPDSLNVLRYEKHYDKEKKEVVEFSKNLKCEKYSLYKKDALKSEIIFDSSDYTGQIIKENKIIPLEYHSYSDITGELRQKLLFQYALPYKYIEYDSNTNKQTKMFILHGIKNLIYKYSFFNSLTGQVIFSGNL